jgi:demethylmenaquinone methyltransferase/2-methoxy-6-polyprenyl-1,4-benzoquinol methylase
MHKEQVLPSPDQKAAYVQHMFTRIAGRYDLMNRLMTLGRDRAWRRQTVAQALCPTTRGGRERAGARVLDVATGTGDLALEALRQQPDTRVFGLDFTFEMLTLARQKATETDAVVQLAGGDAQRLPFGDGVFDVVVTAFALRNVTEIAGAFAEMARVTRAGGRIACLEIAKPRLPLYRRLFAFYFYRLVPLVGGWITGQRAAYTYLPHSLTAFPAPDEIAAIMSRTGWRDVSYHRMTLGTVAVHTGTRADGDIEQITQNSV